MKSFEREVLSDKKERPIRITAGISIEIERPGGLGMAYFMLWKTMVGNKTTCTQQNYFSKLKEKRKNVDNKNRVKEFRTTKSIFTEDT